MMMMDRRSNISLKILECGLMTLYRNPAAVVLMCLPAAVVAGISAYVLLDGWDSLTAGGSVASLSNPYNGVAGMICRFGNILIPMIYIMIPAACALADMQGGHMMKVLPAGSRTRSACGLLRMSLAVVSSVLAAYLAFMICIRAVDAYRPLLGLYDYGTLDDMAVFFVRIAAVALLVSLTQWTLHELVGKVWLPAAAGAVMAVLFMDGGYNVYHDGMAWGYNGFSEGAGLACGWIPFLKMSSSCLLLISAAWVWKRLERYMM